MLSLKTHNIKEGWKYLYDKASNIEFTWLIHVKRETNWLKQKLRENVSKM